MRIKLAKKVHYVNISLHLLGSYYKPLTGRFTCPYTGVYYISVSIMGNAKCYVKKDDLIVLVTSNSVTNTSRNSAIVNCTQDEDIYVEGFYNHKSVFGAPEIPYSTFTVFLMYTQTGIYILKVDHLQYLQN